MGYALGKSAPSLLRMNYEKYLYPYDIFMVGAFTGEAVVCIIHVFPYLISLFLDCCISQPTVDQMKKEEKYEIPLPNTNYQASRRSRRGRTEDASVRLTKNDVKNTYMYTVYHIMTLVYNWASNAC